MKRFYREYGACRDRTYNYFFEGARGREDMERIMAFFRSDVRETIGGRRIVEKTDYMGDTDLPKADVIRFLLDNGTEFMIRPSGTEAKIKGLSLSDGRRQHSGSGRKKLIFEQASTSETTLKPLKEKVLSGQKARILGGIKWKFEFYGIF